jgi:hypothetical protein
MTSLAIPSDSNYVKRVVGRYGSEMRRSQVVINMPVALPSDVRNWIEAKAEHNLSSMNSVIVTAIRVQMDAERCQERPSSGAVD